MLNLHPGRNRVLMIFLQKKRNHGIYFTDGPVITACDEAFGRTCFGLSKGGGEIPRYVFGYRSP